MSHTDGSYIGNELPLFARATNWKKYLGSSLEKFLRGSVLEVGSGFGGTAAFMMTAAVRSWTALEPDRMLACKIKPYLRECRAPIEPEVIVGTLSSVPYGRRFDCITYIDVLEHIEHDAEELRQAASLLNDGGYLIVVSPAYQWLFSPFDAAVGHYRRYATGGLRQVGPQQLNPIAFYHLDSVGVLASLANRFMLRQASPNESQIEFWDRRIVPVSRWCDPLVGYTFGRSAVGIWKRTGAQS